ncbi:MAG: DUF86 domain-containing protein [Leptospiraceae bacterium]|nr:DUF86 domain-containing protein [Leptospiraceae bacterium]
MTERDIGYAIDIVIACRDIEHFKINKTDDALQFDEMYQAAVIRKLEVIGEVAKRLSDDFKTKHFSINWKGWAGLRDRLIHGYDDIDLGIDTNVLSNEIPLLLHELNGYEAENSD